MAGWPLLPPLQVGGGEGRRVGLVGVASGSQPLLTGQERAATGQLELAASGEGTPGQ